MLKFLVFFSFFVLMQCKLSVKNLEDCKMELISSPIGGRKSGGLQCLYKCFYEKSGLINLQGKFLVNNLREDLEHNGNMTSLQKETLFDCLEDIERIENCEEVDLIGICFNSINM